MKKHILTLMTLAALTCAAAARPLCAADTIRQQDSTENLKTKTLDSLVVTGSNVTHYADRDVVRITRAMRKGARNTAQMLGKIPGIDCDYSNNALTYYGSSNILILVDSLEKPADYIKELHHLRYYKVDVVPNPTGKYANYDVLINLHTKTDYEGYEGNVFNYARVLPTDGNGKGRNLTNDNASAAFTYTKNKWNVMGRYNFSFRQSEIIDATKTETLPVNQLQRNYLPSLSSLELFRIHNFYTAADYQINKNHSVSLSYLYSTDATDNRIRSDIERIWQESQQRDTIASLYLKGINSTRHTLGLYYRGRSGAWNYTYDLNYVNDGWDNDRKLDQSSGYSTDYRHHNHMDYIWTKKEVNRRFFNEKFYASAGHNFTWKDYTQKDRQTDGMLSENTYLRNEFWTWMSYRIKDGTDLNFSAAAEHVHTEAADYKDNDMVYKVTGMFFHRWNKWLWMRLNWWCNVSYPQLDQVSDYGHFTDSLTWWQGNPTLKTSVNHSGRIWLDFLNTFNIQGGFNFSPNSFSTIADVGHGMLPSGVEGNYVTYIPRNTRYRDFWASFYIYKQIKAFTLSGTVKYEKKRAEYMGFKNHNEGFSGYANARYYNDKHHLTLSLRYELNTYYQAAVQGLATRKLDYFSLVASKDFFKQKFNVTLGYIPPLYFTKMKYKSRQDSPAVYSEECINIKRSNIHVITLSLSYRFNGGKSVRQYNRSMQEEK